MVDAAAGSAAGRSETARLEAFSDAVIAIAMTILALELRVPILEAVTSKNLVSAILDQWPSYFAFALSFTTILIMWINHHARLSLVDRIDGLLMFANGFLMMAIVALSYPTALVGEYLNTPAGRAAAVTYGLAVLATSAAWNIFMLALRPERGLLRPGVPPEVIATTRRRVAIGFLVYLVATGVAAVNAYLGLGIMTAMWVFWATFAYRALNRQERWSADAIGGSEARFRRGIDCVRGLGTSGRSTRMTDNNVTDDDLAALIELASEATSAFIGGDMHRYFALIEHADDYTLMSPTGGEVAGSDISERRINEMARFFQSGEGTLEVIQTYASGDLAVLVAVERQSGVVGDYPAQDWSLRVTLVFRREGSKWQLAHRHADALVHPITFDRLAELARG